jgi:hypothetical protein
MWTYRSQDPLEYNPMPNDTISINRPFSDCKKLLQCHLTQHGDSFLLVLATSKDRNLASPWVVVPPGKTRGNILKILSLFRPKHYKAVSSIPKEILQRRSELR